jgi:hypothetical protein
MLAEPKDGHVWQSEARAPASAPQGEAERQSALCRRVRGKTARPILYRFEQEQSAG